MTNGIEYPASWVTTSISNSSINDSAESAIGTAIDLSGYLGALVSVELTYGVTANQGALVYVLPTKDGTGFLNRADNPFGFEMPKTTSTQHNAQFSVLASQVDLFKVLVRNPSGAQITGVTVRYRLFRGVSS